MPKRGEAGAKRLDRAGMPAFRQQNLPLVTLKTQRVADLPVDGLDEVKRTNEIGMAIPLLAACDITGKDITGDALLTQRALASYIVSQQAHYHFTVKGNQPGFERDIALLFDSRSLAPDFSEDAAPGHGRIEIRRIWYSTALNGHLDFAHVGQVFLIERETIEKKTGTKRCEIALGVTSRTPQEAAPRRLLALNRGHWAIEAMHHILDWNYDEDRGRIRTGHGPENITRLRRFTIGILRHFQKPTESIAEMMRRLCFRTRTVFDYLRMTNNSRLQTQPP